MKFNQIYFHFYEYFSFHSFHSIFHPISKILKAKLNEFHCKHCKIISKFILTLIKLISSKIIICLGSWSVYSVYFVCLQFIIFKLITFHVLFLFTLRYQALIRFAVQCPFVICYLFICAYPITKQIISQF